MRLLEYSCLVQVPGMTCFGLRSVSKFRCRGVEKRLTIEK